MARRSGKHSSPRSPAEAARIEEAETANDPMKHLLVRRFSRIALGMSVLAGASLVVLLVTMVSAVVDIRGWDFHPLIAAFFLAAAAGVGVISRRLLKDMSYPRKDWIRTVGAGAAIGGFAVGILVWSDLSRPRQDDGTTDRECRRLMGWTPNGPDIPIDQVKACAKEHSRCVKVVNERGIGGVTLDGIDDRVRSCIAEAGVQMSWGKK